MPTIIEGVKFYKVPQVAKLLGVTPQTVRAYINRGRLKSVRIGRPIYITETNLIEFLQDAQKGESSSSTNN